MYLYAFEMDVNSLHTKVSAWTILYNRYILNTGTTAHLPERPLQKQSLNASQER